MEKNLLSTAESIPLSNQLRTLLILLPASNQDPTKTSVVYYGNTPQRKPPSIVKHEEPRMIENKPSNRHHKKPRFKISN
jgi:hypothetical protein